MYQMNNNIKLSTPHVINILLNNDFIIINNILDITIIDNITKETQIILISDIVKELENNSIIYKLYNNISIKSNINVDTYTIQLEKEKIVYNQELIDKLIYYKGISKLVSKFKRFMKIIESYILEQYKLEKINNLKII